MVNSHYSNIACCLFLFACFKLGLGTPLVGVPLYCRHEGARVQVSSTLLDVNSCLMCFCKNHTVQCNSDHCTPVEGCYRLQKKSSPECCPTCLGCIHEDKDILHGHSWHDKCRIHQCQAGVLTSSNLQCHVPCSQPLPPGENKCCPTCLGCWLEGHPVAEGTTRNTRLDPCVKCSCVGGELHCTKRPCPVLSCPPSRAVLDPDGCCPVCNGSREIYVLPEGRCFLGKYLYQSGDNRTFDQCTTCTCNSGYLSCERQTCPPLRCPEQYRQTTDDHCCPSCVYPKQSQECVNDGIFREHGEVWHLDRCSTCTCDHGRVTCQVDHCEYMYKECPVGSKKVKLDDDCCPRCVKEPGVCVTYGDPHYKTFDSYHFNFQGECRYELAKDCVGREFSVRVNNDARRSSFFSWTRSLSIKVLIKKHKFKISLGQRLRTKVNRKRVKLPFQQHNLKITRRGHLVTVKAPIGLEVNWDGASYVEVKVASSWANKTCGLCGNFNHDPIDDIKTKKGQTAISAEDMANSWRSGKARACSRRLRRLRAEEQRNAPHQIRSQRLTCLNSQQEAKEKCRVLNSTSFDACRREVSIDNFYESCLVDMCECPSSRMCQCDAVVAFIRECERACIEIPGWRNITKCGGFQCPYGSMYMECAPACRPSCNKKLNPNCHMGRCKPGCYCPSSTVLHRGSCIPPEQCPKKKRRGKGRKG